MKFLLAWSVSMLVFLLAASHVSNVEEDRGMPHEQSVRYGWDCFEVLAVVATVALLAAWTIWRFE